MPESAPDHSGAVLPPKAGPSDKTAAYHGSAETSGEAHALRNLALLDERKRKIQTYLRCMEPATADRLMSVLDIPHQSIGTILLELMEEGKIHRPGTKAKTRSGRQAWLLHIGPGKCVGRPPRVEDAVALLRRFKRALETGGLTGPAKGLALTALEEAGL